MATNTIAHNGMMTHARELLALDSWARGVRNRDGRPVFLFASRGTGNVVYFSDVDACSCPGYAHRGLCGHVVAVRERDEAEARENGLATLAEVEIAFAGAVADKQAGEAARRRSELLDRLFGGED